MLPSRSLLPLLSILYTYRFRRNESNSTIVSRHGAPLNSCRRAAVTLVLLLLSLMLFAQNKPPESKKQEPPPVQKEKKAEAKPQPAKPAEDEKKGTLTAGTLSGLQFRLIGPAAASVRVIAFAVHPNNKVEHHVGV